jgi:hypothetical protein
MFALAASGIFSVVCASMFALNCLACSRKQARSQVAADAALLKANNAVAANAKLEILIAIFPIINLPPSWTPREASTMQ